MPAVTFLDPGTDATQDLTFWNIGSGGATPTSATDQAHTGTRSLKSVNDATNQAYVYSPNGVLASAGSAISFWLYLSTAAPTSIPCLCTTLDGGDGASNILVGLSTSGKLVVGGAYTAGTTIQTGTTTLSANTWYRITLAYVVTNATSWSATVYLNGVSEVTVDQASGTLAQTVVTNFALGNDGTSLSGISGAPVITMWFDDIYVDNRTDKTDPGNVVVTAKRPIANGTANGFTTQIGAGGSGTGTGHAPQVNERPLSTANGWSLSLTTKTTEEYTVESLSAGDVDLTGATIKGVMGWVYADNASALNTPVGHIIVDGTATAITVTQTPALYTQVSPNPTTYPAGTGTDIGIDGQYTTTPHLWNLFEAGVLVAYLPAAADTLMPQGVM